MGSSLAFVFTCQVTVFIFEKLHLILIGPVRIDNIEIELVSKFKYIGSIVSMKDKTSQDIGVGEDTARRITSDIVWKDDLSISLKKRFVYFLCWSFAQFGSESGTFTKKDEKRI